MTANVLNRFEQADKSGDNAAIFDGTFDGTAINFTKTVRQSADVVATENTTLANLTGLVFDVIPGTYNYRVVLQTTANASGGVKAGFKLTGTVLGSIQNTATTFAAAANTAARTTTATDEASLVASTTAAIKSVIEGTFVVTTGGTVQVRGAQNASNASATTFHVGSTFELTRVG
jgi:hypothetical protein